VLVSRDEICVQAKREGLQALSAPICLCSEVFSAEMRERQRDRRNELGRVCMSLLISVLLSFRGLSENCSNALS
jgi:hypothetical protein